METIDRIFETLSRADRVGVIVTRTGLIIVLLWIGALKAAPYEADGIVPLVANSPLMGFFYKYPVPEFRHHRNPEGALIPGNRTWNQENRTYIFAYGLGTAIVIYGLMLCLHPWLPRVAAIGSFLVFVMSPRDPLFSDHYPGMLGSRPGRREPRGPYLSGAGRLVVKDAIMMGAALVTMADSAKAYLRKRSDGRGILHAILIELSTVAGAFAEPIVREMVRPVIFPLSNPRPAPRPSPGI